jgi:hypothetical protein
MPQVGQGTSAIAIQPQGGMASCEWVPRPAADGSSQAASPRTAAAQIAAAAPMSRRAVAEVAGGAAIGAAAAAEMAGEGMVIYGIRAAAVGQ